MARSDAHTATAQSPVKKYLTWSSDEKGFKVREPENSSKSTLPLPVKFIHYDEFSTIKGWDEPNKTGIYCNEVKSTKTEPLTVRTKHKVIAEGLYQDVKAKANAAGAFYHVSLYAELGGDIVNFAFKASALGAWSKFCEDNRKKFLTNYIKVVGSKEEKNGIVKYHIPVFEIGDEIEPEVSASSDKNYDELVAYFKQLKAKHSDQQVQEQQPEPIMPPAQDAFTPAFDEPADSSELPF